MNPHAFTYEDFCTREERDNFKRMKRRQMRLAGAARNVCVDLTGARIGDGTRSRKRFLRTHLGLFRMAMGHSSDNSTEESTHRRMGTLTIYMGERDSIMPWLRQHGVDVTWPEFIRLVGEELG